VKARERVAIAAALVLFGTSALAQAVPAPPAAPPPLPPASTPPAGAPRPGAAPPGPAAGPAAPAPSPVPPTSVPAPPAPPPAPVEAPVAAHDDEEPAAPPRVVPTADAVGKESDHAAVVGAWGIEVRPVATTLPVFARRSTTGCPSASGAPEAACPAVPVSMLGVRHWLGPNLALNGGIALALGGGRDSGRLLDSYFGLGPSVGASVLLGNWRHLAIAASPSLTFVVWKAASSADSTYVADLRADVEGELHFGFIGVPALALSLRSGLLLRLEHAGDTTLWAAGVAGATTLRSLVSDLTVRYYF
jgi:hypothetical protein